MSLSKRRLSPSYGHARIKWESLNVMYHVSVLDGRLARGGMVGVTSHGALTLQSAESSSLLLFFCIKLYLWNEIIRNSGTKKLYIILIVCVMWTTDFLKLIVNIKMQSGRKKENKVIKTDLILNRPISTRQFRGAMTVIFITV